ncbi:hypothetical protein BST61_g4762 [Cercospora zeina]
MFFRTSLGLAAAAAIISAAPVQQESSSFVLALKRVANVSSMKNIVANGQAKISKINSGINVGGNTWDLVVDTGSSNLWCGAQSPCEATSSGRSTGGSFQVSYGSGSVSGNEYTDKVSFGGLTVRSQSLGAATSSSGFSGVDGIIGFGPADLTQGTVSNANTVPTFMDNLYNQGTIAREVLGVYFHPESGSDTDDTNGELTLGGTDSSKYSGSIQYFPTLTSGSAARYWGISISSFTYGSTNLASNAQGIVDTGTTLIYIPTTAYNKFLSAAGGKTDSSSGLASFTTKPTGNFGITFGSTTYNLTPAQYLVPTSQYSFYGLSSGKYYSWISDGGSSSVNTIIGQKFLENYYSVFDTTGSRIGFATRN